MNDLDLMTLRSTILFLYDARGRMVCTNDPDRRPAPSVFLGCTRQGYVVRFAQGVPNAIAKPITDLVAHAEPNPDLCVLPNAVEAISRALGMRADIWGGPAYRFPETIAQPGDAVQLTEANVEVARDTYPWLPAELRQWWPCFAIMRDERVVSICFSSRIGEDACEAGVDTMPAFRGRGYAAAVTAAWAAAVRVSGRIPLYSTSWHNLASQGVARRLGLIMYGADASWNDR